jgi:hypothetical protein
MTTQNEGLLPLGMLPMRAVDAPKATNLTDRTIYEFPVLGAIALADERPWAPIQFHRGRILHILKPTRFVTELQAKGELTNQYIDLRYTVFRIETELYPEPATPQPLEIYQVIHELVHLLRTVARQYWIGLAMANEGSLVQGVRARVESGIAAFSGQGSFVTPFVVSPLDEQSWYFLGQLLAMPAFPDIPEAMLCDALLEIRRGDLLQSILSLAVACEVAVTAFLEDTASKNGLSNTKRDEILNKPFKQKFLVETVSQGATSPQSVLIPKFPANWAATVVELYRLRNQAAHGGQCMVVDNGIKRPIKLADIASYLFSAEALLSWVAAERRRLGIPGTVTATMLPRGYPIEAMVAPNQ